MTKTCALALLGTIALAACSSSSSETSKNGLPSEFGDCDASVCEVQLVAFQAHPGSIPYCPAKQADLDLSCSTHPDVQTATCAGLYVARITYGFPGDYYQCVYEGGALAGAKWAPDNHPTQIAGKQPADGCALSQQCMDSGASDGGTD